VTGAAQGIGQVIARHLAGLGYEVIATDSDGPALDEFAGCWEEGRCLSPAGPGAKGTDLDSTVPAGAAEAKGRAGGTIRTARMDVTNQDSVRSVLSGIGTSRMLVALINNAAISHPASPEELSLEHWNRVIETNLTGPLVVSREALAPLCAAARERGIASAIINLGSTRAIMSDPNTEAYGASKGGLVALTHALAVSLGPDIRVNAISPGWIEVGHLRVTDERHGSGAGLREEDHVQHPAGRVGTATDIAAAAAFLISEEARFITGQNLIVDGGMTRRMIYRE